MAALLHPGNSQSLERFSYESRRPRLGKKMTALRQEDVFPRGRANRRCRIQKRSVVADDSLRGILRQVLSFGGALRGEFRDAPFDPLDKRFSGFPHGGFLLVQRRPVILPQPARTWPATSRRGTTSLSPPSKYLQAQARSLAGPAQKCSLSLIVVGRADRGPGARLRLGRVVRVPQRHAVINGAPPTSY